MQVKSQKSAQCEVVILHLDIGLVDAAVGGLQNRHGMLSNCIGGICRNTENGNTALCSCFHIDVVESRAAKKDQPYAALVEDLHDFTGRLVINEDADCVIALGEVRGLDRETAVKVFNVNIISAFALVSGEFTEEHAIIILGSEESDFQDFFLFSLGSDIGKYFLNLGDRCILVRSICSNVQDRSLSCVKRQNLEHIVARSDISVALNHDGTLEIGACLCQKSGRARMDSQRILYCVL